MNEDNRRRLAHAMNAKAGAFVGGNSIEDAIGGIECWHTLATCEQVAAVQASYLALYERLQRWTVPSSRQLIADCVREVDGIEAIMLFGRVADVRYTDYWDEDATVRSICLMSPHIADQNNNPVLLDSHIWLSMADIASCEGEEADISCCIGDILCIGAEPAEYTSRTKEGTMRRMGLGVWTPFLSYLNYCDHGVSKLLEQRELLSAEVFALHSDGRSGSLQVAKRTKISQEIKRLKELPSYSAKYRQTSLQHLTKSEKKSFLDSFSSLATRELPTMDFADCRTELAKYLGDPRLATS